MYLFSSWAKELATTIKSKLIVPRINASTMHQHALELKMIKGRNFKANTKRFTLYYKRRFCIVSFVHNILVNTIL